ncbi:MAG: phosphate-starvation-inducible PsiE family protein [Gammaproteobacteria bacterium]|nr:phosphate-starvation-inducible PsiE family protein [Gammaproteobacteria bacterium]
MFNDRFNNALRILNYTLHLFIAFALAAASVLIMIQFSRDVLEAFREHILAAGFLHALGTLFIVWVLSALISAEITYMRSGIFHVEVFFEVAMITLLRQLILIPVKGGGETIQPEDLVFYAMISGALLATGIAYFLVARSQLGTDRQAPRRLDDDQANDHSLRNSR